MRFDIGDFRVYTKKEFEILEETYFKPVFKYNLSRPDGYEEIHKYREFTIFEGLNLLEKKDNKYYRVIDNIFDFIDLIEILKAFSGNKLSTDKIYRINDKFEAKIVTKNKIISLFLYFKNYSYGLFLDKFECSSLAAKFLKILSRCEVWQEQDQ